MMKTNPQLGETEFDSLENYRSGRLDLRTVQIMNLPPALIFNLLPLLLYKMVFDVDILKDSMFIILNSFIGVFGLTFAYSNVFIWVRANRSGSTDFGAYMFSIFYNNCFYVFNIILCSAFLFPDIDFRYAMVLTQFASVTAPAYLSSLDVYIHV